MAESTIITRMSNGETIDMKNYSADELQRMHYEEERYVAKHVMDFPAFSDERMRFYSGGYALVKQIARYYKPTAKSYGASKRSVELLKRLIKSRNNTGGGCLLYEAGVGLGYAAESVLEEFEYVSVCGCDMVQYPSLERLANKYGKRFSFERTSLYRHLQKMEDESIDVFYADNVFEHLFPDEFDTIMKLMMKKLKKSAVCYLVIPNRYSGPHDISGKYLPFGARAEGFHFMEKTQEEVNKEYKKYGLYSAYKTIGTYHHIFAVKSPMGKVRDKIMAEHMMRRFKTQLFRKVFVNIFCLNIYVMKVAGGVKL